MRTFAGERNTNVTDTVTMKETSTHAPADTCRDIEQVDDNEFDSYYCVKSEDLQYLITQLNQKILDNVLQNITHYAHYN